MLKDFNSATSAFQGTVREGCLAAGGTAAASAVCRSAHLLAACRPCTLQMQDVCIKLRYARINSVLRWAASRPCPARQSLPLPLACLSAGLHM